MASRSSSVGNITYDEKKDEIEAHGGPLHFPTQDNLRQTDSMKDTIFRARAATEKEHKMTLLQGIRLYPKAIGWSMLISTCIVMEGYDVCLINNFYAFPEFNKYVCLMY